jgi:hypothetical protein
MYPTSMLMPSPPKGLAVQTAETASSKRITSTRW